MLFYLVNHAIGRLAEDAAKFYAAEVLLAFEYLHGLNIIYRDLKVLQLLQRECWAAENAGEWCQTCYPCCRKAKQSTELVDFMRPCSATHAGCRADPASTSPHIRYRFPLQVPLRCARCCGAAGEPAAGRGGPLEDHGLRVRQDGQPHQAHVHALRDAGLPGPGDHPEQSARPTSTG